MYHDNASGCQQTSAPPKSANGSDSRTTLKPNSAFSTRQRLSDSHYRHCCGNDLSQKERGLNPDWVTANCYSASAPEASELLGYPAKSGGIVIEGANGQYHFRPDRPWSGRRGQKAPKYRNAAVEAYDAFLPAHPTEPDYWLDLEKLKSHCYQVEETIYPDTDAQGTTVGADNKEHPGASAKVLSIPCLLVTEGGFKAIAACSHNLPTLALLGVEMGLTSSKADPQGQRYLVPTLETLAKAGFGFILAFDADITTKPNVKKALSKLGFQLQKLGTPVYVLPPWDEKQGKGIDDYIQMNDIETFRKQLLGQVRSFADWSAEYLTDHQQQKLTKLQRAWHCLQENLREKIRFNELTLEVEIEGEPADLDQMYLDLELNHNIPIAKERAIDLAIRLAKTNAYHPVKDYLNQVASDARPIELDHLSQRYLGTSNPIYDEMFKRHLIGSVARVFHPGCKKDEVLVLKGPQGIGKSTFLQLLYGEDFFSDSLKGTDRDNLLVLHQHWCLELAEIETITGKRQAGELKSFISANVDTFRAPYARSCKRRRRSSVLVATVNPDTFLVDPTGNRRYWVIEVEKNCLDWNLIQQERDRIWAAAVQAYRAGESWHLPREVARQVNDLNHHYLHEDAWTSQIADYLAAREITTTLEVLLSALDFEPRQVSKRDEMRVAAVLKNLGWKQTRATYRGKRQRVWVKIGGQPTPTGPTPDPEVGPTGTGSGPGIGQPGQPGQPQTENSVKDKKVPPTAAESSPPPPSPTDVFLPEEKFKEEVVQVVPKSPTQSEQGGQPSVPLRTTRVEVVPVEERRAEGQSVNGTEVQAQPTVTLKTVDYSTYPHLTSNDRSAKQKRANQCQSGMLACATAEELARWSRESGFSSSEIDWVYRQVLTPTQKQKVSAAARAEQLNLFSQPVYEWDSLMRVLDSELSRLGWTLPMAQNHLLKTYGVKSRHLLTDEQIIEFWRFLQAQ